MKMHFECVNKCLETFFSLRSPNCNRYNLDSIISENNRKLMAEWHDTAEIISCNFDCIAFDSGIGLFNIPNVYVKNFVAVIKSTSRIFITHYKQTNIHQTSAKLSHSNFELNDEHCLKSNTGIWLMIIYILCHLLHKNFHAIDSNKTQRRQKWKVKRTFMFGKSFLIVVVSAICRNVKVHIITFVSATIKRALHAMTPKTIRATKQQPT